MQSDKLVNLVKIAFKGIQKKIFENVYKQWKTV